MMSKTNCGRKSQRESKYNVRVYRALLSLPHYWTDLCRALLFNAICDIASTIYTLCMLNVKKKSSGIWT